MEKLGTHFTEVDIKEAVEIHFRDIGQDSSVHDITYENCQARERTQILMDVANKVNGMVIGTGDMSELALGWATYNGDYMLHDFFLYYMLRCGFAPDKVFRIAKRTFEGTYDAATILKWLKIFYKRFFSQQFKRSCIPDGPKVGSVALSPRGDLRMPSDASVDIWMGILDKLE